MENKGASKRHNSFSVRRAPSKAKHTYTRNSSEVPVHRNNELTSLTKTKSPLINSHEKKKVSRAQLVCSEPTEQASKKRKSKLGEQINVPPPTNCGTINSRLEDISTIEAFLQNKTFTLVDLRDSGEFSSDKFLGSINMPYATFTDFLYKIPKDRSTPLIVYGETNDHISEICSIMAHLGYIHICSGIHVSVVKNIHQGLLFRQSLSAGTVSTPHPIAKPSTAYEEGSAFTPMVNTDFDNKLIECIVESLIVKVGQRYMVSHLLIGALRQETQPANLEWLLAEIMKDAFHQYLTGFVCKGSYENRSGQLINSFCDYIKSKYQQNWRPQLVRLIDSTFSNIQRFINR